MITNSKVVFAYTDVRLTGLEKRSQLTLYHFLDERCNLGPTASWCIHNKIKVEIDSFYQPFNDTTRVYIWAYLTPEQKTEWYLTLGPTSINED